MNREDIENIILGMADIVIDKFPQASKTFCELLDNVKDKNHISCYGEYYKEL